MEKRNMKISHDKELIEIREMMGTIDAQRFPKEDIINYVRLTKEETGVDNDIMVDNSQSYIQYHHPLWVYVRLGNKKFGIITVDYSPKILHGDFSKVDVSGIVTFLATNNQLLHLFADKKLLGREFYNDLIRYDRIDRMVMEMANMQTDESGLPCEIWIDDTNTWKDTEHGPRIKYNFNPNDPDSTGTITLPELQVLHVPEPFLSSKLTETVKRWVDINKKLLMDIANETITYCKFLKRFTPFDGKGNPIIPPIVPCGEPQYGYTMVEQNGKFNFINKNNELVSPNQWFDKAEDFGISPNHEFYAVVYIGNNRYCLFKNGEMR